jgi:hypothetical protein
MPGHTGGSTSKLCSDRYLIQKQLDTGKTRKGHALSDEKRAELELDLAKVEALIEEESARRQKEKTAQRLADRAAIIDGVAAKVDDCCQFA